MENQVVNKKWYLSKTLWLNVLAIIAIVVQSSVGKELIPVDYQTVILAVLNLLARSITKTNITL